jgi:transitional endoplasmic reticulum ATPase
MKPLDSSARLSILKRALLYYGCPLEVSEGVSTSFKNEVERSLSQEDFSAVAAATEGLQPGDIWKLCKRLSLYAARREGGAEDLKRWSQRKSRSALYSTAEEVVSMAKEHPPSSSSSSSSSSATSSTVSWQHIGGLDAAKAAITDIFQLPVIFRRLFQLSPIRMPRAMLLYGPPGCGKTILAQAAANECGLAFISVRGAVRFSLPVFSNALILSLSSPYPCATV